MIFKQDHKTGQIVGENCDRNHFEIDQQPVEFQLFCPSGESIAFGHFDGDAEGRQNFWPDHLHDIVTRHPGCGFEKSPSFPSKLEDVIPIVDHNSRWCITIQDNTIGFLEQIRRLSNRLEMLLMRPSAFESSLVQPEIRWHPTERIDSLVDMRLFIKRRKIGFKSPRRF